VGTSLLFLPESGCSTIVGADFDRHARVIAEDAGTSIADTPTAHPSTSDSGSPHTSICLDDAEHFYVAPPTSAARDACTFSTIAGALTAAARSHAKARTIHVAAGRYDATSGETFPLHVSAGVSLQGAGATTTRIAGLGPTASTPNAPHATLIAGDEHDASSIAGLSFYPSVAIENAGVTTVGILCERGNAERPGATVTPPNLRVDEVTIGAAYDRGIVATARGATTAGCNLKVTRSHFEARTWNGVFAEGCTDVAGTAYVAVDIGDADAFLGNRFDGLGVTGGPYLGCGSGIKVWQCVSRTDVRGNVFDQGDTGLNVTSAPLAAHMRVASNTFRSLNAGAIQVWEAARIDTLEGNLFVDNDAQLPRCVFGSSATEGGAVWLHGRENAAERPSIAKARRNTFVGNRRAVHIDAWAGPVDFGQPSDPGGNVFRCNSHADGFGGDIRLTGTASATFFGNAWDHEVPAISKTPRNGLDVWTPRNDATTLVLGATLAAGDCPANHTPGDP
jgi:hypothetical protein